MLPSLTRLSWAIPLCTLILGCAPKIGKSCTLSTDCSQLGDRLCDTTQPEGYCTIFNCEPDTCPDSACVGFYAQLDPACGTSDDGRTPRFERTFCMAPCSSDSSCRDGYECVDLSRDDPNDPVQRGAKIVDIVNDIGAKKVCMAAARSCKNETRDGEETDVDCGGPTCPPCEKDKKCGGLDANCVSMICSNNICVSPPASCKNKKNDPAETDVDCGGPTCTPCQNGKKCADSSDCVSLLCENKICVPPQVCGTGDAGPPWTPYDAGTPDAGTGGAGGAGGAGGSMGSSSSGMGGMGGMGGMSADAGDSG